MRKPYILYKRQAGIKKQKRLQYYVAFWNPETQDYSIRRATGFTAESDADAQARKWLAEGVPDRGGESLYAYLAGFWASDGAYARVKALAGRPLAAGYLQASQRAIAKYVLPWLEEAGKKRLALEAVTPGLLERMVVELHDRGDFGARRVNAIRQAIGVALAEARRLGKLKQNPMQQVLKLKESKPRREILSMEEARVILSGAWSDERYRLANLLAASTGMRLGEIRGLQTGAIVRRGEAWELQVRTNWQDGEGLKAPKQDSYGDLPLPPRLAETLIELAAGNPWGNGFVFYGPRREAPAGKREIEQSFNAAVRAAGISEEERRRRGLTFHSWRHWYDSYLRGKVPDHALQALTRHKSERLLDHYSHVTEEQRLAVAELADGVMGPDER
jgi:integrase